MAEELLELGGSPIGGTMRGLAVALSLVFAAYACDRTSTQTSVELDPTAGIAGFIMADHVAATVVKSSELSETGDRLTFINLGTEAPTVVFESGDRSPLKKVYEDNKTMTLVLVGSGTGSIDAFVIDKERGLFARGTATAPSSLAGIRAHASVGTLK